MGKDRTFSPKMRGKTRIALLLLLFAMVLCILVRTIKARKRNERHPG